MNGRVASYEDVKDDEEAYDMLPMRLVETCISTTESIGFRLCDSDNDDEDKEMKHTEVADDINDKKVHTEKKDEKHDHDDKHNDDGDNDDDDAADDDAADDDADDDDDDDEDMKLIKIDGVLALNEHFILYELIQSTSTTAVYRAIDKTSKRHVCVKLCVRYGKAMRLDRAPIEARITSYIHQRALQSVCTCSQNSTEKCYHHGFEFLALLERYMDNEVVYVTVSRLERESSYRQYVFDRPEVIMLIYQQLKSAVTTLHHIGVLYRDIKQSNVLYDDINKRIVLTDFDLSTFVTDRGHCEPLGTAGFMAPEVLLHDNDDTAPPYSTPADVWSLGAFLGSLLYGCKETHMKEDIVDIWRQQSVDKHVDDVLYPLHLEFLALTTTDPNKRPVL